MSSPPCRSPADALAGEGTGAGLRHPQEFRGSGAPSPACARSPRRWAGSLQRRYLVPPEKQVSLFCFSSSFSAYFTSPCGGCRGTPHSCPPTGFPPRPGAQPGGRATRLWGGLPEPPRPELPSPGSGAPGRSPPAARLGRAGLDWAGPGCPSHHGSGGSAGPAGKRCPAAIPPAVCAAALHPFPGSRARQRPGVLGGQRREGASPAPVESGSPRWGGCGWGVSRSGCGVYEECVGMHMGAV